MKLSERLEGFRARLPQITLDESTDLLKAVQIVKRMETGADGGFHVVNLVSHATGEGKLDVTWLGQLAQLDAVKAREIAWILLEAAAVAEAEASFMRFIRDKVGVPIEKAAMMLHDFREYRTADPQSLVEHKETH
jgi:hypothetical protein